MNIIDRLSAERTVEDVLLSELGKAGCWTGRPNGDAVADFTCPLGQAGVCAADFEMDVSRVAAAIVRELIGGAA